MDENTLKLDCISVWDRYQGGDGSAWKHGGVWNPFEGSLRASKAESGLAELLVVQRNADARIVLHRDPLAEMDREGVSLIAVFGSDRTDVEFDNAMNGGIAHGFHALREKGGSAEALITKMAAADDLWIAAYRDGKPVGSPFHVRHFNVAGDPGFADVPLKAALV